MTSIPASRRARATTLAPRSCPSRPGLATTMRNGDAATEAERSPQAFRRVRRPGLRLWSADAPAAPCGRRRPGRARSPRGSGGGRRAGLDRHARRSVPAGGCSRSGPGRRPPGTPWAALRPVHRGLIVGDVEAAGTPILLVHGVVDNRSVFTVLRRGLRRRGFGRVSGAELQPADRGRPRGGAAARRRRRGDLRGDRLRTHPPRRALDGRPGRALLRAVHRRRPAGAHGGHAGHAARGHAARPGSSRTRSRDSCARAARSSASSRSRPRAAVPASSRSGPTSTRW